MSNVSPPPMEKNQNATGITLSFRLSEAIHWTTKRMEKNACPTNPTDSQNCSLLIVPLLLHGLRGASICIVPTRYAQPCPPTSGGADIDSRQGSRRLLGGGTMTSRSGCILLVLLCCLLAFATSASAECAWVLWEYNPTKQNPGGSPVPVAAFAEGDGTCKLQMGGADESQAYLYGRRASRPGSRPILALLPRHGDPRGSKGK